VSPEQIREVDTLCLAQRAVEALGVNGKGDAAHIMEHAIAQASLELGVVEAALDAFSVEGDKEIVGLCYLVSGIRARLELAQHSAGFLARTLAESEAANG
jgi:hypothetical protein